MSDIYTINCKCDNCDYTGPKELPKKTSVPDNFECPNCGCESAAKIAATMPPAKPASTSDVWEQVRRKHFDWPLIRTADFPETRVWFGSQQ